MSEPIHEWFELTYANYLVLPRSVLQSMPESWQERFVAHLKELREATRDLPSPDYEVRCRDARGRYIADPIPHYNRGRTVVPLRGTEQQTEEPPDADSPYVSDGKAGDSYPEE